TNLPGQLGNAARRIDRAFKTRIAHADLLPSQGPIALADERLRRASGRSTGSHRQRLSHLVAAYCGNARPCVRRGSGVSSLAAFGCDATEFDGDSADANWSSGSGSPSVSTGFEGCATPASGRSPPSAASPSRSGWLFAVSTTPSTT